MSESPKKSKHHHDPLEYEVEKILDHKYYKDDPNTGIPNEYLVKWKNWPETTNSWVEFEHMQCDDLIQGYLDENNLNISRKEKGERQKAVKKESNDVLKVIRKEDTLPEGDYRVEKVINHRGKLNPKTKLPKDFLLKWQGFPEEESTWEPTAELKSSVYQNYIEKHRLGWFHPDLLGAEEVDVRSHTAQSSSSKSSSSSKTSRNSPRPKRLRTEPVEEQKQHSRYSQGSTKPPVVGARADISQTGEDNRSHQRPLQTSVYGDSTVPEKTATTSAIRDDHPNEGKSGEHPVERDGRESSLLTSDEEWD